MRLCSPRFFNEKGYLLYYNVAVYILVQSEEYSISSIFSYLESKTLTIQTGKGKY